MVTGNFALLAGVSPQALHEWYLMVYADAFEWVELPNTLGMSQFGDGGLLASKPYVASGAYINRMSNHCKGCRYDVGEPHGAEACPFNALYWALPRAPSRQTGEQSAHGADVSHLGQALARTARRYDRERGSISREARWPIAPREVKYSRTPKKRNSAGRAMTPPIKLRRGSRSNPWRSGPRGATSLLDWNR